MTSLRRLALACAAVALAENGRAQDPLYSDSLLPQVRVLAGRLPGPMPTALHYIEFARWTAPLSEMVEGATSQSVPGTNVVFQIRYPDRWIMVDAGVSPEVDSVFAGGFLPEGYDRAQLALRDAQVNIVTHEHHDHVAGIVRSAFPAQVIGKSLLTRAQIETLRERPNKPLIRLTPAAASRYRKFDYDRLHALAPGVVLIKAPGHTPGSQMVYVSLASGREALLIGDIVWMMAGIEGQKQKPDSISRALGEDRPALQEQIDWLHGLMGRKSISLVPCHDRAWLSSLLDRGVLRSDLDISRP